MSDDVNDLLAFAREAARAAGEATLTHFGATELAVERKADGSPVTRADREAERILRERIAAAWPDDAILGEEEGERPGTSGRRWILDPVDGTRSFTHGVPLYGTLLALESEAHERVELGVVYLPALREMMYAARGQGAFWTTDVGGAREATRPARVSAVGRLEDALMCTTSVGGFAQVDRLDLYRRLRAAVGRDRGWSDCYGHMLVATGRAELMVDARMAVWDCAALQPIVEEAGGVFMDLAGAATHRGGSALSVNAALAEPIRGLLR
jgi:histidinol phosphatase-like enzyme (inositol monophosphatase family)